MASHGDVHVTFKSEISDAISGIVDRDVFLQRLARRVAEIAGIRLVAIYTRPAGGGDLVLRSSSTGSRSTLPPRLRDASGGGITTAVVFPIATPGDPPLGALAVVPDAGRELSAEQRALLAAIAGDIAPAIEVAEHHHAVKQSSVIDLSTGTYAAWFITQRLEQEIARAMRTSSPLTVVLVGIADFEALQARLGFEGSDDLLRALAAELSGLTRVFDIVGMHTHNVFAVVLPETPLSGGHTVAQRIHQRAGRVLQRFTAELSGPPARLVTGVATFPADGEHVASLLLAAEHRMAEDELRGATNHNGT